MAMDYDTQYLTANPTWHLEDAEFKAFWIKQIVEDNHVPWKSLAEVGCGVGGILRTLRDEWPDRSLQVAGYDISSTAIELARKTSADDIQFSCGDIFETDERFDLLLIIDVIEHVPEYYQFLAKCRERASFKVYHIPLDIHVSSVVRGKVDAARLSVGHIHFFTRETALTALRETGHRIIEDRLTPGGLALFHKHRSLRRALVNVPRWAVGLLSDQMSARLFGGYSLLVLAE